MDPRTPKKRRALIMLSVVALVAVMLLPTAAIGAGTFDDVPDDHTFAADIEWLADAGITKGCNPADGNTKFCPDNPVTRGQMSAFMNRFNTYLKTDFLAIDGKADTAGHADTANEAEYAANAGKLDGLDSDDLAPRYLTAVDDQSGLDFTGNPAVCITDEFTPTEDMTALILTETTIEGPGGGAIEWGTKASYSTDGGSSWVHAAPNWWLRVESDVSTYNGVTSDGLVELEAGTSYMFAHNVWRMTGPNDSGEWICKTVVQLSPRTSGSGIITVGVLSGTSGGGTNP